MPKTYTTILGIHYGHDGGVAIVQNGKVVAAINEERIRNIKHYNGTPSFSISEIFKISQIDASQIDALASFFTLYIAMILFLDIEYYQYSYKYSLVLIYRIFVPFQHFL